MVNGIINVYKEKGYTSFDVVAKLRGVYHQKKIGHTGTLDPDAEGVLPVCLGKATKVCDLLTDKDKEYEAVLLLGKETDTQDISGKILAEAKVQASEEEVERVIHSFIGAYDQIPPMYSALKVEGQKLCDLARKGITVERKARRVQIYGIEIEKMDLPEVTIKVHCSKGTYIRTLCHDIGEKLGCHGCMKSLIRTRVSAFSLEEAHRLSEIEEKPTSWILPVDVVFSSYEKAVVSDQAEKFIVNGNRISQDYLLDMKDSCKTDRIRFYREDGTFIGIYEYKEETLDFKPVKLFLE
ncbi:MAG: tRNA pseudouridine(55) synthase TruB [Agathobacter sp.]